MSTRSRATVAAVAATAALLTFAPAPVEAASSSLTIDFSEPGQGSFDQSTFEDRGVTITEGGFVGYVQGDQALIGPIGGTVDKGFTTVSAEVAPYFQGTADYTLSAYSRSGREVGSTTVRVTQDDGEPGSGSFGYVTIDLTLLKKATGFRLSSTFVRSSYPDIRTIGFGASDVTFEGK